MMNIVEFYIYKYKTKHDARFNINTVDVKSTCKAV